MNTQPAPAPRQFLKGEIVTFQGFDGSTSVDTVYDAYTMQDGQHLEMKENECVIKPSERERLNLRLRFGLNSRIKNNRSQTILRCFNIAPYMVGNSDTIVGFEYALWDEKRKRVKTVRRHIITEYLNGNWELVEPFTEN